MAPGSPARDERGHSPGRSPTEENEGSEDKDEEPGEAIPLCFLRWLLLNLRVRTTNKKPRPLWARWARRTLPTSRSRGTTAWQAAPWLQKELWIVYDYLPSRSTTADSSCGEFAQFKPRSRFLDLRCPVFEVAWPLPLN
jgi:hypothetical protein